MKWEHKHVKTWIRIPCRGHWTMVVATAKQKSDNDHGRSSIQKVSVKNLQTEGLWWPAKRSMAPAMMIPGGTHAKKKCIAAKVLQVVMNNPGQHINASKAVPGSGCHSKVYIKASQTKTIIFYRSDVLRMADVLSFFWASFSLSLTFLLTLKWRMAPPLPRFMVRRHRNTRKLAV